ncbi:hypothetical protein Q1695_002278 [Nippostrongylus brasiliensis]|nr:hypothetical protein Q1695_002278 [Nippostrongylus brasiliensis]
MVTIKKVKKVKKAGSSQKARIIPQVEVNTKSNRKRKLAVEPSETKDVVDKKSSVIDEKPTKAIKKDDTDKVKEIKEQGQLAIKALKKHLADRSGKSLFPDIDHAVGLTIVYKKPALTTDKARVKIELPCPYRTPLNTSICLIMPDLDQTAAGRRDPDVDKQARQWAEKIEKDHGLTNQHYSKIMTKRQMEREYHTFTQRRALATTYDVFLVDVRVGKAVRTFLGKEFYKVHKEPLDFNYSKPLVTAIEKAVKSVTLKLQRYATRVNVSFGHLGQQLSDLSSNFETVVDAVLSSCPGGLSNIRSIYMQPVGSTPSLPVFVDDGTASEVQLEKPPKVRRAMKEVADECSTLPDGLKLVVRKNGKLRVIKEDNGHTVFYPTVHDEWEERDGLKPLIDPSKLKQKYALKKKRQEKRLAQKKMKSGKFVTVQQEAKTEAE